jgi:hypothetical protein
MSGTKPAEAWPGRKRVCDAGARKRALAEQATADIRQDLGALNAFVETHGSFAEMVREHFATIDGDAPGFQGDRRAGRFSRGAG